MEIKRRNFLKTSVIGAGALLIKTTGYAKVEELNESVNNIEQTNKTKKQLYNMCGYAAPAIPTVRIGFIGIGSRGSAAVERILHINNTEVAALCDVYEEKINDCREMLMKKKQKKAKEYYGSKDTWKKLCEQKDIDLVYIATPWALHTPMAVYAMECGKHVAVEVPAACTLEECWQLVETSERTKKHCCQLENCCYDFFEIMTTNMAHKGVLGELMHGEGAYIHEILNNIFDRPTGWRWQENRKNGNLYPTHGLGPICWAMNINRGDQMDYLTSMATDDFMMQEKARQLAASNPAFEEAAKIKFRGNLNTSLVRTHKGKTILIQHDISSPRPYSRLHLLSGTKGFVQKYPEPGKIALGHGFVDEATMKQLEEKFTPELVKHISEAAKKVGGHGGMDFIMDWRLMDCLRNGLPLDMDVYDAANWSCITPLSIWSIANRSNSIDVPDFTCGAWKTNTPVDLTLRNGGNTEFIG
ncbi:Gfo/Idh/MocA family oxidoreductase [uncultured Parabacteroides sp.]|uniref:Gfo/Idh/MocA family protein n=1 Tax=uncultured Parabacteroides sp. TaxID=512312 RepID=UPI00259B17D2|nr:Gfo/Idh/MocA family oxidoreductase [uncultured Parabacteroides sp.]